MSTINIPENVISHICDLLPIITKDMQPTHIYYGTYADLSFDLIVLYQYDKLYVKDLNTLSRHIFQSKLTVEYYRYLSPHASVYEYADIKVLLDTMILERKTKEILEII